MTGLPNSCAHPLCAHPATTLNRAGQPTCERDRLVVVMGSWVDDGRKGDRGHG